jgi:hypothetical protein
LTQIKEDMMGWAYRNKKNCTFQLGNFLDRDQLEVREDSGKTDLRCEGVAWVHVAQRAFGFC